MEQAYLLYCGQYHYLMLSLLFGLPAAYGIVSTRYYQTQQVMALMNCCRLIPMIQDKWVRAIASYQLVPGDVIVLQQGRALCDMVMLQGACLVTESMLSGEVGRT